MESEKQGEGERTTEGTDGTERGGAEHNCRVPTANCLRNQWSDEARAAALAVRRAKSAMRKKEPEGMVRLPARPPQRHPGWGALPPRPPSPGVPGYGAPRPGAGDLYAGGTPWFDEATGQYVMPVPPWMPTPPWLPPGAVRPGPKPGRPWMPGPGRR